MKKAFVEEKAASQQTGGGPPTISTLDDADLELLGLIHDNITPLENPFDFNSNATKGKFFPLLIERSGIHICCFTLA